MFKHPLKSVALGAAIVASCAAAHAQTTLLSEGFDFVDQLSASGWVLSNESTAGGNLTAAWFNGSSTIFPAQAGPEGSYASSSFDTAAAGGTLANYLITPTFSTAQGVVVTFYARADILAPYFDTIAYGFSPSGAGTSGALVLGSATTVGGGWTQYSAYIAAQGAGTVARFGIQYAGLADNANYVGIDSLTVTAVPEPAGWLMMGAGLIGLLAARRRRA